MVGPPLLSESLDAKNQHEVMRICRQHCVDVIRHYGGFVFDCSGDGVVAYYWYQDASENSVQSATRSALNMIARISQAGLQLNQFGAVDLAVQVGIDTGLVMVDAMGEVADPGQSAPIKEMLCIATKLSVSAKPNSVAVSEQAYRFAKDLFDFEKLGRCKLKDMPDKVLVYKVLTKDSKPLTVDFTPMVGRDTEMVYLLGHWFKAITDTGQVVMLMGEAGVGKTRLVNDLQKQLALETKNLVKFHCTRRSQNSVFYPIIEYLRQRFLFTVTDGDQDKWRKLEAFFASRESDPCVIPVLASLLSLSTGDQQIPYEIEPGEQRDKIQTVLVNLLYERSKEGPVLLVVEDLHWIDPSTLALLDILIQGGIGASIMLLMTTRPGVHLPWDKNPSVTYMDISRLDASDAKGMIEAIPGAAGLSASIISGLVDKTDGIPLFIEESTKMVLESDRVKEKSEGNVSSNDTPPVEISGTLQDMLMTRLDYLGQAKNIAQAGAVVGEKFSYECICGITHEKPHVVKEALDRLEAAGLVKHHQDSPGSKYSFKHALIRDAAYHTLLKRSRKEFHFRIAEVMETHCQDICDNQPEIIAEHYTQADMKPKAMIFWLRAGHHAMERSAYVEAIRHSMRGLGLLENGSNDGELEKSELGLQLILGNAHAVTKGYAAMAVEKAFSRAKDLCESIHKTDDQIFVALFGLWRFFGARGDIPMAMELAQQFMLQAKSNADPVRLHEANYMLGNTYFMGGELLRTQFHLEQVVAVQDSKQSLHAAIYSYDLVVASMGYLALTLWALGQPDQSLRQAQAAVVLARSLGHPHSLVIALNFLARVRQHRQERTDTAKEVSESIEISTHRRFAYWKAIGVMLEGWARSDQDPDSVNTIRKAIDAHQAAGAELSHTYFLSMLAEACLQNRAWEEGLGCLVRAINMVRNRGEAVYEGELYRLRGELLLGQDPFALGEARDCFQRALDIARAQKAKGWELRATTSMSRLLLGCGDAETAGQMLSDLYYSFSEGLDTVDLMQAKELLARAKQMLSPDGGISH